MDRKICICILLGSFHLLDMPKTVGSCAGHNTFSVIEMCNRGEPTEASYFNIYAAPSWNVQRCVCNLTMIGDGGGLVTFTTKTLSSNCGGTLTVPGGSTTNCTTTVYEHNFVYRGTYVVSFTFNTVDVSKCLMVHTASSSIRTECTGTTTTTTAYSSEPASASASASATATTPTSTFRTTLGRNIRRTKTTNTAYSSEPASANTSTSTITTASPFTTRRTQLPTTQSTDHTATVISEPWASLTVVIAGGVGAGLLMLLVVVAVATVCYRRVSSVPESITGHEMQGREERSSEEANGQPVPITSPVDNDIVSAFTDLSTHSPTNHRASSGSCTNDHLGSETQNRSLRDNYNSVTFESAAHPSQRCEPHICTGERHKQHSYDYLDLCRTRPGFTSDVDGDTLPPLYNESHARQIESGDIYNHLRRASQPHQWSVDYDTIVSAAKFVDDMQSVYSYDRLKTGTGPSGV